MNDSFPRVTDAERRRWQLRSTNLMIELIQRAQLKWLPPVAFTVGNHGATLVIRCNTRAEWQLWVTATGVDQFWSARQHGTCLHLHGDGDVLSRRDGAPMKVAVIADLTDQDEPPTADPLAQVS